MKSQRCILGLALLLTSACESPSPTPYYAAGGTGAQTAYAGSEVGVQQSSLPPADADLLYQRRESDAFGSSTYTGRTQVRGPVVEEVHIGNQQVFPQPTSGIYDPTTGRFIPVRRR